METQIEDREANAWARMRGLMAVLALPAVRCADGSFRRRRVEVEVRRGGWMPVDSMIVEADKVTMIYGVNGRRVEYVFHVAETFPEWRLEPQSRGVMIAEDE